MLIEELHITITAPARLSDIHIARARRLINSRPFQADLRRAVRLVFAEAPLLVALRVRLSR
jgi:hypothetical protein